MASLTKDLPPLPPLPADQPTDQPQKSPAGVFRRLTSRLRSPSQSWAHVSAAQAPPELDGAQEGAPPTSPKKEKSKRKGANALLSLPPSAIAHRKPGTELENSFTSAEQRQAALRAMGLTPASARPGRDAHGYKVPLSEQETHLDQLYAVTPEDAPTSAGEQESEAQKIKEAWMRKNGEIGGAESGRASRDNSRSPERTRRSPEPRWKPAAVVIEQPAAIDQPPPPLQPPSQPLMTAEQVRARRKDDPVFAPSGLLAAMQAYRPENYQPPPGRKPSGAYAMQQRRGGHDSDSDSDASV
jgi:hypothetical protein